MKKKIFTIPLPYPLQNQACDLFFSFQLKKVQFSLFQTVLKFFLGKCFNFPDKGIPLPITSMTIDLQIIKSTMYIGCFPWKKMANLLKVCSDWTIMHLGCSLAQSSQTVGLLLRTPMARKAAKMMLA